MEQPITPEPDPGTRIAVSVGEPVVGQGRVRTFTAVGERSQRMHRFTGNLLSAVADATAGGVEGVAVGCLNGREAGESVLELGEVISRLQGLRLRLLAHADGLDVCTQVDGVAAVDTAGWLAQRGLVSGRAARTEVRLSEDLTGSYAATGSALLAGDVETKQAETIVWAIKRLVETSLVHAPRAVTEVDAAIRARAQVTSRPEGDAAGWARRGHHGHRHPDFPGPGAADGLRRRPAPGRARREVRGPRPRP